VNPVVHQVTSGIVHQTMTGECVFAGKCRGNDADPKMRPATGAGMAGVAVRFVLDVECLRRQGSQTFAQQGKRCFVTHAGKAFLNGLTVTF